MQKKVASSTFFFKYLLLILVPVFLILFLKLNTKHWNGKDKLSLVIQKESGNVEVLVFDPSLSEVATLVIPGTTEIEVARNLGRINIKNIWQLGVNEKLGGSLLVSSIAKDFSFPVYLWSNYNPGSFKFLTTKDSNLPIGDRIAIGIFLLKTKSIERTEIDLGKSQFIVKSKLDDGSLGYRIPGEISQRLTFYFSDNDFAKTGIKVNIKDSTGVYGASEVVGKIVEVMGGKVVNIEKAEIKEDEDCLIWGQNKKSVQKISRVFSCKIIGEKSDFDVQIELGKKFAKRF